MNKRGILIPVLSLIAALTGPYCFAQPVTTGEKLFSILTPDHTHIRFDNQLKDSRKASILLYSNYYGGGGVGVGDINNDGLEDIYFAGNLVGDKLYLNKGNMVFEDITEKAGIVDDGGWSSGVVFGDVNNDGYTDIYVTRELYDSLPDLRRNLLYINNGNNTFTESAVQYGVDDNNRTRGAVFLDYDKDGDLDLFILNQPPNPGVYSPYENTELLLPEYSCRLMENTGSGFVDVTKKAGLFKTGFPNSVTASDLNGDGWTDLWVTNDYWAPDFIYLNNGDGTFRNVANKNIKHMTYSSMGIDAADINNDGLLDVMILDMIPKDHVRLQSNMGGPSPEVFQKTVDEGGHYQYFINTIYLNNGDAHFSEIAHLAGIPATDWSWSILFADLDNDGWKDVFIGNGLMRDIRDYDAQLNFSEYIQTTIQAFLKKNPNPENIGIWDIADMDKAMKLSPSVKLSNYGYRNNHDLTFSDRSADWGLDNKTFSNGAAYADLDNDGDIDIVVSNVNEEATIYRNNAIELGTGHFLGINPVPVTGKVCVIGTKVRIETDSGMQFFEITGNRGMYSCSENRAHFGLGTLDKVNKVTVTWPDGRENILKNVKADQEIKVEYRDSKPAPEIPRVKLSPVFSDVSGNSGIIYVHNNNSFDDFRVQQFLPYRMSDLGPYLAKGDVNGDGRDDLFVGGAAGYRSRLYIQQQNGEFEESDNEALKADSLREDMGAVFFDADGDGDKDLYVVSGGNEFRPRSANYQDRLYLNDGNGKFTKAPDALPKSYISGSNVYACDYDNDGDQDLFVGGRSFAWSYPDPESSMLLRNDGGKFTDVTKEVAPDLQGIGMVNDAVWVDFNGDGHTDLVLAGEWMPVTFLENDGVHFKNVTSETGLADSIGWWFSIKAADMDHDGDMDLVAGNFGMNSEYRGTAGAPLDVYHYDFDNNGLKDLVFGVTIDGKKYPMARKKDAAQQVPFINNKFRTFASYAEADLNQIYGKENLEHALHYSANAFASIYIENLGNGKFRMHALPEKAQFSVVNGIVIDDFNADGNPDILVSGNMYTIETSYPRSDAAYGLLLEGDGKGNFKSIDHNVSGFYVPYDVRSMVNLNGIDNSYIAVGCNNDSLRVYKVNKIPMPSTGSK